MRKKDLPLIKTNSYLKAPAECDAWLTRAVISSSAIEGVRCAACRALGVKEGVVKVKADSVLFSKSSRSRH